MAASKLNTVEERNIIIYQTKDGKTIIETRLENETVWLRIDQMAELFQKSRSTVNEHIIHIYEEQELEQEHTLRKIGNSDFSIQDWIERLNDFLRMTGRTYKVSKTL